MMEFELMLRYCLKIGYICGMMFMFSFVYFVGLYLYGEYGYEVFWSIFCLKNYFKNYILKFLCDINISLEEYCNE